MIPLRASALVFATFAALQCSDGGTAPPAASRPGTAVVSLTTPYGDDGAVVFTLRGAGMSALKAASRDYVLFSRASGPDELKVIVVGDLTGGALVRVDVPAIDQLTAYSATVHQAAARDDVLRGVDEYRLTFAPATP